MAARKRTNSRAGAVVGQCVTPPPSFSRADATGPAGSPARAPLPLDLHWAIPFLHQPDLAVPQA